MQTLPLLRTLAVVVALAGFVCATRAEDGDATRGERISQYCFSCHSVDPNEQAQLEGPSLYHLIGRPAASLKGFNYSDAMRKRGADGLKWDAATLNVTSPIPNPSSRAHG
jgi:cytochrome c